MNSKIPQWLLSEFRRGIFAKVLRRTEGAKKGRGGLSRVRSDRYSLPQVRSFGTRGFVRIMASLASDNQKRKEDQHMTNRHKKLNEDTKTLALSLVVYYVVNEIGTWAITVIPLTTYMLLCFCCVATVSFLLLFSSLLQKPPECHIITSSVHPCKPLFVLY